MKKITIGRASDNDIVLNVSSISSHHADMELDRGRIILTDHSMNGTRVNGQLIHNDSCIIREGDQIVLPGRTILDWERFFDLQGGTQRIDHKATTPYTNRRDDNEAFSSRHRPPHRDEEEYGHHHRRPHHDEEERGGYYPEEYSHRQERAAEPSVSFGDAISIAFSKYADFSGRARRSEFWWYCLFNFLMTMIPIVNLIWFFAGIIPGLAISVRRLHDLGKSGWNLLFMLIPFVGGILLLIWFCQDGQTGTNEYGPSTKYKSRARMRRAHGSDERYYS